MVLRMPQPVSRPESTSIHFRARVPADVLEAARGRTIAFAFPAEGGERDHIAFATAGTEVKFSLRTQNPAVGRSRHVIALGVLSQHWEAIRSGPKPLTHRQIVSLSGEVYALFVERFDENPGTPDLWAAVKAFNRASREGRLANPPRLAIENVAKEKDRAASWGRDLTRSVNALNPDGIDRSAAMEVRFGWLADWVLTIRSVSTNRDGRISLLEAVDQAVTDAAWRLKRAAQGDYTPDAAAERFPKWSPSTATPSATVGSGTLTLGDLVSGWAMERKPRPKTIQEHKRVANAFAAFIRHDVATEITPDHVVGWKDSLVAEGRLAAKTINAKYLTPLNTVLNWGKTNRRIKDNPAEGVRCAGKAPPRVRFASFSDAEVRIVLKAANASRRNAGRHTAETLAAQRWVPWLCAYTGARVSEITQLRGEDIYKEGAIPIIRISPDAGAVKANKARIVPIHPHLIEQGLLDFVDASGEGPLFYATGPRQRTTQSHPSKTVAGRLSQWIRQIGIVDPNVQPNHAWRHLFISLCRTYEVQEEARYFIVGHASRDIGQSYGEASSTFLYREILKIPRFEVD